MSSLFRAMPKLKPLEEQVIVITGASSGIGLATARKAAEGGAAVVLAARDGETLNRIADEIVGQGGRAVAIPTDVGDEHAVEMLADKAVEAFGRIDTWVNNAGIGAHGHPSELKTPDHERILKTDYWGTVFGSLAALRHFRQSGEAGAIINIGSVVSDLSVPLMTVHSATKHAVAAYTQSLRLEVLAEGDPVAVTLVKPSNVATPGPVDHSPSTGDYALRVDKGVAPELVAGAILTAAVRPIREVTVGSAGLIMFTGFARVLPELYERIAAAGTQKRKRAVPKPVEGNLYRPRYNGRTRGDMAVAGQSLYTQAQLHPQITAAAVVGVAALGGVALALLSRRR